MKGDKNFMSRTVILTEKSSVAQLVAKALKLNVKKQGYYENQDGSMVCSWFMGHLLEVKKPDEINPDWKSWKLDVLPFDIDTDNELKIRTDVKGQFKIVKDLIVAKETTMIISMPDADIEGVKLQFELLDYIKNKKPVKVVWIKDMTEKTIIKGVNNLLEVREIESKYERGKARAYLDYHLGMNMSRGATLTFGNGNLIRFGRCITPLLSLLVQREKEIEGFKPVLYFEVSSVYGSGFTGMLISGEKKDTKRFAVKGEAEGFVNGLSKKGIVKSCKSEEKQTAAPKLFSLQTLQSYLGGKYGISPDKTLEICQSLYEKALTTYPRTDSEFITKNQWLEVQDYLNAVKGFSQYKDIVEGIKVDINKLDKNYVNDAKVTAHSAITVTANEKLASEYEKLNDLEKKVFDEILKRFIAIFMPAYKYNSSEIIVDVDGSQFISKGNVPVSLGWKALYKKDGEKDTETDVLPDLKEGEEVEVSEFKILDKQTTAPTRYGVGNIVALEKQYKIGTPATQSSFIPKLIQSGYVEEKKGKYYATTLGKQYIESLSAVPELSNPNLATAFEEKLESIENEKLSLADFKAEMVEKQKELIEKFKTADKLEKKEGSDSGKAGSKSLGVCPLCGKDVVENKKGYGCTGWKDGCKFTIWKTIAGKEITTAQAKELIEKGRTSKIIKGFKKKDGGSFNAYLVRKEDGSIGFDFKKE